MSQTTDHTLCTGGDADPGDRMPSDGPERGGAHPALTVSPDLATIEHETWCDPDRHQDGNTLPDAVTDPAWQLCQSTPLTLDFGPRGIEVANTVTLDLSYTHPRPDDEPDETRETLMYICADRREVMTLQLDQGRPLAFALLAKDALARGELAEAALYAQMAHTTTRQPHTVDGTA